MSDLMTNDFILKWHRPLYLKNKGFSLQKKKNCVSVYLVLVFNIFDLVS